MSDYVGWRIQRLPQPVQTGMSLFDKNFYVWFWKGETKMYVKMPSAEAAAKKIADAEKAHRGAFASGPIPCNKGQHGVFAVSCYGETANVFFGKHYQDIKKAHDSVFSTVQTVSYKEMPIQTIGVLKKKDALKVNGVLSEKEMQEAQKNVDSMVLLNKVEPIEFDGETKAWLESL